MIKLVELNGGDIINVARISAIEYKSDLAREGVWDIIVDDGRLMVGEDEKDRILAAMRELEEEWGTITEYITRRRDQEIALRAPLQVRVTSALDEYEKNRLERIKAMRGKFDADEEPDNVS